MSALPVGNPEGGQIQIFDKSIPGRIFEEQLIVADPVDLALVVHGLLVYLGVQLDLIDAQKVLDLSQQKVAETGGVVVELGSIVNGYMLKATIVDATKVDQKFADRKIKGKATVTRSIQADLIAKSRGFERVGISGLRGENADEWSGNIIDAALVQSLTFDETFLTSLFEPEPEDTKVDLVKVAAAAQKPRKKHTDPFKKMDLLRDTSAFAQTKG